MTINRKVFLFVVYSLAIYLLISVLAAVFHFGWTPLKRVNLIADIITKDSTNIQDNSPDSATVIIENKPHEDFNLYHKPQFIIDFSTDTAKPSLGNFVKKLHELKSGKKRKVRIAYFGDSMIGGNLLTQTLRKLLQQEFGGNGVGFVPITSQVSGFRQTAVDKETPSPCRHYQKIAAGYFLPSLKENLPVYVNRLYVRW